MFTGNFQTTYTNDKVIHKSINVCSFKHGFSRIHHKFWLVTGEYNQAVAPLCVPKDTPAEQNFVIVKRISFFFPVQLAFKFR